MGILHIKLRFKKLLFYFRLGHQNVNHRFISEDEIMKGHKMTLRRIAPFLVWWHRHDKEMCFDQAALEYGLLPSQIERMHDDMIKVGILDA
tara:strand:- start:381 stop:653 length:273 start_codon:yes stop_codon:yes gene_type:complete